jgi:hypothetical protein
MSCEITDGQQDKLGVGLVAMCVLLTCMVTAVVIAYVIDYVKDTYKTFTETEY